jgi:hypothetical protein
MKNGSTLVLGCVLAMLAGCADVPGGESTGAIAQDSRHHHPGDPAGFNARGLLNRDGSTDFAAGFGSLDDPTLGSDQITNITIRVFDASSGHLAFVDHMATGSVQSIYTWILDNVQHGQPFEIQALIRSAGTPQPVVFRDYVRFRPDLRIGPDHGIVDPMRGGIVDPLHFFITWDRPVVGVPTLVATLINEINHDVSALTSCVLKVDGAVVDHADAVWVSAGGQTPCAFVYTFTSLNLHQVSVELQNIVPSPYSIGTPSVSQTITAVAP